jgi:membrane-associated HD superfamily phosphohydrolase
MTEKRLPRFGANSIEMTVSWMRSPVSHFTTRVISTLLLLTALAFSSRSGHAAVPHLKLGDVAAEDIVTPVPLVVLDPEATDALKEKVAQQSPSIVRYTPQTASEVEIELRSAISGARTKFLSALDALQDHKPTEADFGTPVYAAAYDFVVNNSVKGLPIEILAPMWLRGQSDQALVDGLLPPLRAAMAQPILASSQTDASLPPDQPVRLTPVKSLSETVLAEPLEASGQPIAPDQLLSVLQARQQVRSHFTGGREALGNFVADFVRANARFDSALTDVVRSKRVAGLAVNDTFEAAQVIVHKGQTIDRKAMSAIAVLREKSLIGTLQTKLDQEQSVAGLIKDQTKWVTAGLALMVVALSLILWRLRTRPAEMAPTVIFDPALAGPMALPGGADDGTWKARALIAEGKAERAHEAIRSGVLGWMRDKIFRTMFHQRAELLSSQQSAEAEMHELEQRLEQLHTPLQERIDAYEKRIHELEQELADKVKAHAAAQPAGATKDQADAAAREEMEKRLAEMNAPFQERISAYARRIQELERDLTATLRIRPAARPAIAVDQDAERSVHRRELTLAEREQAIGEAELRIAERVRDLNEMDALLRAREMLLSAPEAKATHKGGVVKVRGAEALKQFRAELGLPPTAPVSPPPASKEVKS